MPREGLAVQDAPSHESSADDTLPRWSLSAGDVVTSLLVVATLSIAQPLLDLLGRNAAFFVAHDATGGDVVALALGLTFALPLLLAGAVLGLRVLSPFAAAALHAILLTAFGAVLVLVVAQLSGVDDRLDGLVVIAVAVILGGVVPVLYWRSAGTRRVARFAALTAPVVVALFLVASPASALVFNPDATESSITVAPDAPPVVMVVFDEVPVASLLTPDGAVDGRAFPAFGRLARDATFWRNTTTVAQQTSDSVPAALTGHYADLQKLPVAADHPDNLIALLGDHYRLHVEEPITQLCPPGRCRDAVAGGERYWPLVRDLSVVARHLVLPADFTEGLPPIDHGWRDFRAAAADGKEAAVADRFWEARTHDPAPIFERFVDNIEASERPTLHFVHTLLPHHPFRYLPDGRSYTEDREVAGMALGLWDGDPWAMRHSYQRHLLQLQLADRLLGRLLDRLEAQGIYDNAMIVVMADHGVTFTHGLSMRGLHQPTFAEIAAVPLFIKLPGQTQGAISDAPVELIDVAPTVLDVVGAQPPADIAGQSLVDGTPSRDTKRVDMSNGAFTYPAAGEEKWPIVQRKAEWFPHEGPFLFPYNMAPAGHEELLGTAVPQQSSAIVPDLSVELDQPEAYADVDLSAPFVPAYLQATVVGPLRAPRPVLAIGVNGTIAAVTLVESGTDGRPLRAMLPPHLLRDGENDISLWLVQRDGLVELPVTNPAGA